MKFNFTTFLIVLFLWNSSDGFSQDSIPVPPNVKEANFLKFQDHFFKALAQKSIYNYRVAIDNLEKCNELKPNNVSVLFELSKNYLMMKKFFEAEQYATKALKLDANNYWILQHLSKVYLASSNIKKAVVVQEKLVQLNANENEKLVFLYFQNNQIYLIISYLQYTLNKPSIKQLFIFKNPKYSVIIFLFLYLKIN